MKIDNVSNISRFNKITPVYDILTNLIRNNKF